MDTGKVIALTKRMIKKELSDLGPYHYVGTVADVNELPLSANVGDVYNVGPTLDSGNYAWNGTAWDKLGNGSRETEWNWTLSKTENLTSGFTYEQYGKAVTNISASAPVDALRVQVMMMQATSVTGEFSDGYFRIVYDDDSDIYFPIEKCGRKSTNGALAQFGVNIFVVPIFGYSVIIANPAILNYTSNGVATYGAPVIWFSNKKKIKQCYVHCSLPPYSMYKSYVI